jgi:ABC-2 type transport system ATP-binding protein
MSDAVLRTLDLTKVYADFWGRPRVAALSALNLEVHQGEVFGLLGPNGSGKTTTIKLLLGLLRPTRGDAFVFGRDPTDLAVKHRLGYLPEETYLYQFLDAEETLAFFGSLFHLPRALIKRRSDELIEMVGLGHARRRRLGEYSKGMARRLGLAQALINDPDLVVLDEPTSGLDPLGSAEVKELIIRLKAQGKTVLLCSHLLADVEDLCDRIAILHQGTLRECGRVEDLLRADDRVMV